MRCSRLFLSLSVFFCAFHPVRSVAHPDGLSPRTDDRPPTVRPHLIHHIGRPHNGRIHAGSRDPCEELGADIDLHLNSEAIQPIGDDDHVLAEGEPRFHTPEQQAVLMAREKVNAWRAWSSRPVPPRRRIAPAAQKSGRPQGRSMCRPT